MMIIAAEIIFVIITAVILYLWIRNPVGNYEPWRELCGAGAIVCEILRRKNVKKWVKEKSDYFFQKIRIFVLRHEQEKSRDDLIQLGFTPLMELDQIASLLSRIDDEGIPSEIVFSEKFKNYLLDFPKNHSLYPQLAGKDIRVEFCFKDFFSQEMDIVFDALISKMPFLFSSSKLPVDYIFVLDSKRSLGATGTFIRARGNLGIRSFIEKVIRQFPTHKGYAGYFHLTETQMTAEKDKIIVPEIKKYRNILILEPIAYPDKMLQQVVTLIREISNCSIHCITVIYLGDEKQMKKHKESVIKDCEVKILYRLDLYKKPTDMSVGGNKEVTIH